MPRLETYRDPDDVAATAAAFEHSPELQEKSGLMLSRRGQASPTTVAAMLFLPAVNQMIDITHTRLHGDAHAPAGDRLRHARGAGADRCAAGGLSHGRREGAQLAAQRRIRGGPFDDDVRHPRYRVPAYSG